MAEAFEESRFMCSLIYSELKREHCIQVDTIQSMLGAGFARRSAERTFVA